MDDDGMARWWGTSKWHGTRPAKPKGWISTVSHITSQAYASCHFNMPCHHHPWYVYSYINPPPPSRVFFFSPSFLPLPITQFHFPTMEILKTGIYQKTSQKFPFTNLWIFDKQSLKNVPKIKNKKSIINILWISNKQ